VTALLLLLLSPLLMAAFELVWVAWVVGFDSQSEVLDTRVRVMVQGSLLWGRSV
jgi:hypothetical protein